MGRRDPSALSDCIYGDSDEDLVVGEGGNDQVLAGDGDDLVFAGAGDDNPVRGDAGDDVIYGETGLDIIVGGSSNRATLRGPNGVAAVPCDQAPDVGDHLHGDSGNDVIAGDNATARRGSVAAPAGCGVRFADDVSRRFAPGGCAGDRRRVEVAARRAPDAAASGAG